MKFKDINPININIKSFSSFFSEQHKGIDNGYTNYLLGKRDCSTNDFFQYDINEIEAKGSGDCAGICPKIMDNLFGQMSLPYPNNTFDARIMSQGDNMLIFPLDYSSTLNGADAKIMDIFYNMYKATGIDKSIIGSITDYDTKKAKILEIINDCANNGHYILDSFYNVKIYVNNISYFIDDRQPEIGGSFKQNNNTTCHPVYNFHCIVNKTAGINTEATVSSQWSNLMLNSGTYSFKVSLCMGIPTYHTMLQLLFNYMFNPALTINSRTVLYNFIMKCKANLDAAITKSSKYDRIVTDGLDNHGWTDWKPDLSGKSELMNNIAWSMGLDYDYVTDSNRENKISYLDIPNDSTQSYYWLRRDINDWFLVSPPEVVQLDRHKEFVNNTDIAAYIDNGIKKLFGNIGYNTNQVRPVLSSSSINTGTSSANIINIFKTLFNYNNYAADSKSYIDTDDKIMALLHECVKKGKCIYDATLGVKIYISKPFSGTATNTNNLFTLHADVETLYNNQIYNGKLFVTIKVGTPQNQGSDQKYTSWSVVENPKYIFNDTATAQSGPIASTVNRNGYEVANQFIFSRADLGSEYWNQVAISKQTYADHRDGRPSDYNLKDSNPSKHAGGCMIVLRAWGDNDWTGKYEKLLRLPNVTSEKSQSKNMDGCMSWEDKYFIDSLKGKLGWDETNKVFADSTFNNSYVAIVTELSNEVADMKDRLNLS